MGFFSKKRNDDDFLAQQLKEEKIYTEFEKDSYYDIGSCIDTIETPIQSKPENYCNTHNSQPYQTRVNTAIHPKETFVRDGNEQFPPQAEKDNEDAMYVIPPLITFDDKDNRPSSSSASQYNNQPDYRKYRHEKSNNVNNKNNSEAKQAVLGVIFLFLGAFHVIFLTIGIFILLPLFFKYKK